MCALSAKEIGSLKDHWKRDRKLALLSILTMDPPPVSFVKLAN